MAVGFQLLQNQLDVVPAATLRFGKLAGTKVAPFGPFAVTLTLSPFRSPARVNQIVIFGSVVEKVLAATGGFEVQAGAAILVITGEPTTVAALEPPLDPVIAKERVASVLVPFQTNRTLHVPAVNVRGSLALVSQGSKQKDPPFGSALKVMTFCTCPDGFNHSNFGTSPASAWSTMK